MSDMDASFDVKLYVVRKFRYLQNTGALLLNLGRNSVIEKFHHDTSIVATCCQFKRTFSLLNWTVVGRLS